MDMKNVWKAIGKITDPEIRVYIETAVQAARNIRIRLPQNADRIAAGATD